MGLNDRPYWREEQPAGPMGGMGRVQVGMPKPGRAVKALLMMNIAVFIIQAFLDQPSPRYPAGPLSSQLGVTVGGVWQFWRYITFQFLHASFWHIALNMLGLYMLGTPLEGRWGTRRFVTFYLTCGVVAGVAYVVIGALGGLNPAMPIIGASGGVYAIVLACAVLFPQFRLIFFLFPVPIRLAAVVIFGGMILLVLSALSKGMTDAAMSDVAHLGGAAAAAFYVWVVPALRGTRRRVSGRLNQGAWQRRLQQRSEQQMEIDRILRKIHEKGLTSLTSKERDKLRNATRRQQELERQLYR